jgi:hypothetical protein
MCRSGKLHAAWSLPDLPEFFLSQKMAHDKDESLNLGKPAGYRQAGICDRWTNKGYKQALDQTAYCYESCCNWRKWRGWVTGKDGKRRSRMAGLPSYCSTCHFSFQIRYQLACTQSEHVAAFRSGNSHPFSVRVSLHHRGGSKGFPNRLSSNIGRHCTQLWSCEGLNHTATPTPAGHKSVCFSLNLPLR